MARAWNNHGTIASMQAGLIELQPNCPMIAYQPGRPRRLARGPRTMLECWQCVLDKWSAYIKVAPELLSALRKCPDWCSALALTSIVTSTTQNVGQNEAQIDLADCLFAASRPLSSPKV